jgi:hypothetical protein
MRGGRPRADDVDDLVCNLAVAWATATRRFPRPGRSDHRGFGDLVYHVFGWLKIKAPDQALRRYWSGFGLNLAELTRQIEAADPD